MAYREGGPPPCHICEEPSDGTCACCRYDICAKHLRSERVGWCRKCADAYYVYMRKSDTGMREYGIWFLGLIPLVITSIGYVSWVFVPTCAYVMLGFPILRWRGKVRRTKKFIAQTSRHGKQLAVPPPKNEDYAQQLADFDHKQRTRHLDRNDEKYDADAVAPPPSKQVLDTDTAPREPAHRVDTGD